MRQIAAQSRANGRADIAGQAPYPHGLTAAACRYSVGNNGRNTRRCEARRKAMHKAQQEKSPYRAKQRIKKAANKAYYYAKNHYRNAPDKVGQLAAKRPRKPRRSRKQSNNQPLVVATAQAAQVVGQFGDNHVEAHKKQERAGTQKPELEGVESGRRLVGIGIHRKISLQRCTF